MSIVPISSIFPAESRKSARITISLNGENTDVSFAPYKTLLEVLREDLRTPVRSTAANWASAALAPSCKRQAGSLLPDARARMRWRGRN